MAFTRYRTVDLWGGGDHTTIQAAINYAVDNGAGSGSSSGGLSTDRWTIWCNRGVYNELIDIPAGVLVTSESMGGAAILRTPIVRSGGQLNNFFVRVANATDTVGLRLIWSSTSSTQTDIYITNCRVFVDRAYDGTISAVTVEGTEQNRIAFLRGCDFYARNEFMGTPTSEAVANVFRMKSDVMPSGFEVFNCHLKTSNGSANSAYPVLAINESTAGPGTGSFSIPPTIQIESPWFDPNASAHPAGYFLKNLNTHGPGAYLNVPYYPYGTSAMPGIQTAYTGNVPCFYSGAFNYGYAVGGYFRRYEGEDYELTPTIGVASPPSSSLESPPGSLIVVKP